jgi:hypothetical protein
LFLLLYGSLWAGLFDVNAMPADEEFDDRM